MLYVETVTPATLRILKRLMTMPSLSGFHLAGGTALALQIGHRISTDLDFFCMDEPNTDSIIEDLKEFNNVEVYLHKSNSTLLVSIEGVKVDFIRHNYPLLKSPVVIDDIRFYSTPDIAAMKIGAIVSRGSKKDFVDLYFLLKVFTLSEILDAYKAKYQQNDLFHVLKSLIYFDDAELEANPNMIKQVDWNLIKSEIIKVCTNFKF